MKGKKKLRIIEREELNGQVMFIIQQKYAWWWTDMFRGDFYFSLQEAKDNLIYFDGTRSKEDVVYEG